MTGRGGGPFVLHITDVLRHIGTQRHVTAVGSLDGLAVGDSVVPPDGPLDVDLLLEATTDRSVTVRGVLVAPFTGVCRRCLQPVEGEIEADVDEVFNASTDADDGETYTLAGEQLDLEPMVRDTVLLSLPLAPLCRTDCQGPDPEAYPVTVASDDDEDAPPPADPRWAGLGDLRFD